MLNICSQSLEACVPRDPIHLSRQAERRILIVDDEPAIRNVLVKIVAGEGFQIDTAQNGREAIEQLDETRDDMVLSDLQMPVLNGMRLLQHVSAHYPDTAMIMITAGADVNSAIDALSAGAYDYVIKPFKPAELRSKIF